MFFVSRHYYNSLLAKPTLMAFKLTSLILVRTLIINSFILVFFFFRSFFLLLSFLTLWLGSGCQQAAVSRVVGHWMHYSNIASSSCINNANQNNNNERDAFLQSTCWVEGDRDNGVARYNHSSFNDSSCSNNQNTLPGNSPLCYNTPSGSYPFSLFVFSSLAFFLLFLLFIWFKKKE